MALKNTDQRKNRKWEYIAAAVLAILVFFVCLYNLKNPIEYQLYEHGATSYDRGVVTEVVKESLEQVPGTTGRYLGKQELKVRIKTGPYKGKSLIIQNTLSTTHNVLAITGQALIIRVEAPEGIKPVFLIYNYDRTPGIIAILVLFIVLAILVGGFKGLRSVLGLLFTMFFVLGFMLPMIYAGYSPVLCSIITVVVTSAASLLLLNGICKKTLCAVLSTIAGVAVSGIFFLVFSAILRISGYSVSESEELLLISNSTGLKVGQVLFAALLISSLGAMMDTALSLSASMFEIKQVNTTLTQRQLMSSGMNIGKDMIGTMTNTLILAFTGSAIVTLLVLISYGVQFDQLMSSDYIAIEIAQGMSGSTGVILSVPITAVITSAVAAKGK